MKTELDLLTEALTRMERQHAEHNQAVSTRLNDLATQCEQWALRLHTLSSQVDTLTAQLKRLESALPKR